jgi:hypothetical protein
MNAVTIDRHEALGDQSLKESFMRRFTAFCAAAAIVASTAAVAHPAQQQSGYYVIRWDNTGVCQIWNTDLQEKPGTWASKYEVVSKPVPTFAEAAAEQDKLRFSHRCTL